MWLSKRKYEAILGNLSSLGLEVAVSRRMITQLFQRLHALEKHIGAELNITENGKLGGEPSFLYSYKKYKKGVKR